MAVAVNVDLRCFDRAVAGQELDVPERASGFVGQSGGMGDPRALSGGIAEALIATVAGLCVAIPSLIAYRYLRGKVERIVVEMEKNAMRMADAVEASRARELRSPGSAAAAAA